MAGYPHQALRQVVRRYLLSDEGRKASINEASKQCNCSRATVTSVMQQLVAQGLLPAKRNIPTGRGGKAVMEVTIRPGSSARGGYVYDDTGKAIRESEWAKRFKVIKRNKKKKRAKPT